MNLNARCSLPPISTLLNPQPKSDLDKAPLVKHATSSAHQIQPYVQPSLHSLNSITLRPSPAPKSAPVLQETSTILSRPIYNDDNDKIQSTSPSSTSQCAPPIDPNYNSQPLQSQCGANGYPSEYDHCRDSFMKDIYQPSSLDEDRTISDLKKIINHCTLIGQFAKNYSDLCNRPEDENKPWAFSTSAIPSTPALEENVTDMINKAFEVLYVLNALKDEKSRQNQQTEIDLIRNKRTNPGVSPVRPKYRRRTKRPAPPGRCHSCNIQETPEWRRGPDGARTLCNACDFAKLTRKRAQLALREQQETIQNGTYRPFHPYAPPPYNTHTNFLSTGVPHKTMDQTVMQ
ncbi:16616_t:CDS:2 [Acaulospora colombiana]|uniref:16616_t:CDS:1 n=1 Tax=Acaulospora colombiana TaxID=27376 RepID=A0ACA9MEW8_9GLOM|nr:16616_t:CDS:2 [Acaulospora colombiana]